MSQRTEEAVWTETRGAVDGSDCIESPEGCVTVVGGQFRIQLGAVSALDTSLFSSAPNGLWLGVSVEGEPELPRRPMGSTPFALYAGHAAGLSCTGCVSPEALGEEALQTIRSEAGGRG